MKLYWRKFKLNPLFLRNYLIISMLIFVTLIFTVSVIETDLYLSFLTDFPLPIIIMSLYFGIKLPTLMHNAAHSNFTQFNQLIGELTAQITLIGFPIVCINHTIHHGKPDTHEDPHSPIGKSFLSYLFLCLHSGVESIRTSYYQSHGETRVSQTIFNQTIFLHFLSQFTKVFFWYSLLGRQLFLISFVPAYLSFLITFAHVNYITHCLDDLGQPIIVNKNSNLWYKMINFLADGIYFHKDHHRKPHLYNPMIQSKRSL